MKTTVMVFVGIFFGITNFFSSHLVAFPSQIAVFHSLALCRNNLRKSIRREGDEGNRWICSEISHMSSFTKTQGSLITVQCWIHQNSDFWWQLSALNQPSTPPPRRELSKGMFPASDYVRFKDEVGFGLTENSWKRWFFWGGRQWVYPES